MDDYKSGGSTRSLEGFGSISTELGSIAIMNYVE